MNGVKVTLVDCESGDWVGVYIDGKLDYEGHDVSTNVWMNMIRKHKHFSTIDSFTVTDEYMENGLPDLLIDIPAVEFID